MTISFPDRVREEDVPVNQSGSPIVEEDVEGIDEPDSALSVWGNYPLDTSFIRNENRTVQDILRRIEQKFFIMNPDFQREFIWSKEQQSKLIESVIMRIPLPVFYLAEDDEGRMIVVDGLQRLSTFQRFTENKMKLSLKGRPELDGKRFSDLPPKLQNRIEDCNLILYIIAPNVPERARLDIFDRVNSGVPLSRQQMRNSLFNGEATRFLKRESESRIFHKATDGSLQTKIMRDREFVNRFCAFDLIGADNYRNFRDMDDFLAEVLKRMNKTPHFLPSLSKRFRNGLKNNYAVFGRNAFRKVSSWKRPQRRSVINAALWDVMSTGLSRYPEDVVVDKRDRLNKKFRELLHDDEEFKRAISLGTSGVRRVEYRFGAMREMLSEVLDD